MKIFLGKFKTQYNTEYYMTFAADSKELAVDHADYVAKNTKSITNDLVMKLVSVKKVPTKQVKEDSMGVMVPSRLHLMWY